jgi:uncharacterized repeat protein (TIGR01451 family)/fimbrial isopeptide formation D2 family protein
MRRALGTALLAATVAVAGTTAVSAQTPPPPSITPADADTIAAAIASGSVAVATTTDFVTVPPSGTPNAVSDVALASFPTDGSAYGILTSGDAQLADDPNDSGSSGEDDGGDNVRGNSDYDVSILRLDFTAPSNVNCLSFEFRFLSDEFPEYVGGSVNDAFVAELDTSDWTTVDSAIIAPNNFAFDPNGDVISINSSGATSMTAGEAAGTTYDGATPLLSAASPVTPGAHSVYFSIFDQGDHIYDSAVFLDGMSLFSAPAGECEEGAEPVAPSVEKTADDDSTVPGGANGYTITVSNPNDEAIPLSSISDTLPAGFTYQGGSTSGDVTSDPTIVGQSLTWEAIEGPVATVPAGGSISLHFDVTVSQTPGEYFNEAAAVAPELDIMPTGPTAPVTVLSPPTVDKTADDPSTPVGGTNGYTITVSNPNSEPVDLDSISDALPAGFGYVSGSTSGDVTSDPTIVGQILTWEAIEGSLVTIPAEDSISLHFGVTVASEPGSYFNEATATAGGFTTQSTGPTAQVIVEALEPPTVTKTADTATSLIGGANGYTITVANPNGESVQLASISDTLPAGFAYVPGSTTGATTADPSVAGQTLTWTGPFPVPSSGNVSVHFGVTVAGTPGQYFNEATADASGFTITPTGPTAPVSVTSPPVPPVECDPVTLSGTAAGDTLLGGDGIDRISGLAGRDRIDAGAGDDELCGGAGGDYAYGRDGIDSFLGGDGNDRLYGGRHGDMMAGGAGHDAFLGGRGNDTILAADGTRDCIVTGRGEDLVIADPGLDLVDPARGCAPGFWL